MRTLVGAAEPDEWPPRYLVSGINTTSTSVVNTGASSVTLTTSDTAALTLDPMERAKLEKARADVRSGRRTIWRPRTGVVVHRDNLTHLRRLPDEFADLVYLDPPFFTQRKHVASSGSFDDRWESLDAYLAFMRLRLCELRRVLKPTGSIYVHCDSNVNAHLRLMLDEIFGRKAFLDEIIWHYETASGAPTKRLHRNHDTIYRYAATKPELVTWNHPKEPWPEKTLAKWQTDESGRIYREQKKFGKRYYIDPRGKLGDDVWEMTLSSRSKERLGYPTQKPESLLARIIEASSNKGDVVLDPFCGCGTTLAVAERLGRRWLGIDVDARAVELSRRRLDEGSRS